MRGNRRFCFFSRGTIDLCKECHELYRVLLAQHNPENYFSIHQVFVQPIEFQPVRILTATIKSPATGAPTGKVTFLDGSATLGTAPLNSGVATLPISTLSIGTHSITASYSGHVNFAASTSPVLSQVVQAAAVGVVSPTSINFGNVTVGVGSSTQSGTLTNTGNSTLTIMTRPIFVPSRMLV